MAKPRAGTLTLDVTVSYVYFSFLTPVNVTTPCNLSYYEFTAARGAGGAEQRPGVCEEDPGV